MVSKTCKLISQFDKLENTDYQNTILLSNKLLNRICISSVSTKITTDFDLGIFNIKKINKLNPLPKIPSELIYITSGINNAIFKTKNNKYAYRINITPVAQNSYNLLELIHEAILTIKLSAAKISPKIIDCYLASTNGTKKKNTHLVIVTEFTSNGDLLDYLELNKITKKTIKQFSKETVLIYKTLINNNVFCIDVKPENILVDNHKKIKLIDFDNNFCGSIISKYNLESILDQYQKLGNLKIFRNKLNFELNEQSLKNGFLKMNILQIATLFCNETYKEQNKNNILFSKELITNIDKDDLINIIICCSINVSKKWNTHKVLTYYLFDFENPSHFKIKNTYIQSDPVTLVYLSYLKSKYGNSHMFKILFNLNKDSFYKYCKINKQKYEILQTKTGDIAYKVKDRIQSMPPRDWIIQLKITDINHII